jgi:hypothetical protein
MMLKIMFGKHELSNNQLPYSRNDSYELIKDKHICIILSTYRFNIYLNFLN